MESVVLTFPLSVSLSLPGACGAPCTRVDAPHRAARSHGESRVQLGGLVVLQGLAAW